MKFWIKHQLLDMFVLLFLWFSLVNPFPMYAKAQEQVPSIPADVVASYIHSIIEADRTIYSTYIVNRLHEKHILNADEAWEQKNALPLPAQFLQRSGRLVAETGTGIRFRLISLWPIYERNGPVTEFEKRGLKAVAKQPDEPYTGVVRTGNMAFFQAMYADKAVTQSCVQCHNKHPLSPKRNFKLNDVMGAIVITIPFPE